jgi:hypothetical protein
MLHILGIGARWGKGNTPADIVDENCNYRGAEANSVYKALTGCSSVPVEKVRNQQGDISCFHWYDESKTREKDSSSLYGLWFLTNFCKCVIILAVCSPGTKIVLRMKS